MPLALANQTNPTVSVQEVECRPGVVAPCAPGLVSVILSDGEADAECWDHGLDIGPDTLEAELRCMHANNLQTLRSVVGVPAVHVRQRPPPVDTGVGAELDQRHLPAQPGDSERSGGVQPSSDADKLRRRSGGGAAGCEQST